MMTQASNPATWSAPQWHSDFGDVGKEFACLRDFAKALLAACPVAYVSLEEPEEGYMYVAVRRESKDIAEVYCIADPPPRTSWRYGVFLFSDKDEQEAYCSSAAEAVARIEPLFQGAQAARQ